MKTLLSIAAALAAFRLPPHADDAVAVGDGGSAVAGAGRDRRAAAGTEPALFAGIDRNSLARVFWYHLQSL